MMHDTRGEHNVRKSTVRSRNTPGDRSTSRRTFLKKGLAVGVGVTALYVAPSFSSVTAKPAYASVTGPPPTELPLEIDVYAFVQATLRFLIPSGLTIPVDLTGDSTVHVRIGTVGETVLTDGAGRDKVDTEMVALSLVSIGDLNGTGSTTVGLQPARATLGEITETTNNTPGTLDLNPFKPGDADSFFDVFFEIDSPELGSIINIDPVRFQATVNTKPFGSEQFDTTSDMQFYDAAGNPTGIRLAPSRLQFDT